MVGLEQSSCRPLSIQVPRDILRVQLSISRFDVFLASDKG